MLDRLEGERIESGRRVLEAQEGERLRVARELHDEVGQTLTAIALRAERAAGEPAARQLEALEEITGHGAGRARGCPADRQRTAAGGTRRSRARQRADRAVRADRAPGRVRVGATCSGSCRTCRETSSSSSTGPPRRPSRMCSGTPRAAGVGLAADRARPSSLRSPMTASVCPRGAASAGCAGCGSGRC